MGFCRRCGDILHADRCKCGGTQRESTTKALFKEAGGSDKWSQRYLSRTSTGGTSSSSTSPRSISPSKPNESIFGSPSRTLLPPSRPASPSKLHQSFLHQLDETEEGEGELNSVFGSVLSPKDHWTCGACAVQFKQEEVIYPHPDAKKDPKLAELFFCRQCFAERFRKGNCKRCKLAVLSDAPFVKHDSNLWHQDCYVCSYCSVRPLPFLSSFCVPSLTLLSTGKRNPQTDAIIDFAGRPSCEACFDAEAYKHAGIAPSPHLSQSEFLKAPVNVPPAPSRWGRKSVGPAAAAAVKKAVTAGGEERKENVWSATMPQEKALVGLGVDSSLPAAAKQGPAEKPKAWRVQQERDKSPLVPSLNELGEKLRQAGFTDAPKLRSPTKSAFPPSSILSSAATPQSILAPVTSSHASPRSASPSKRGPLPPLPAPPESPALQPLPSSFPSTAFPAPSTPVKSTTTTTNSPSKALAARAALFLQSSSPSSSHCPTSSSSPAPTAAGWKRPSHGRSWSVPVATTLATPTSTSTNGKPKPSPLVAVPFPSTISTTTPPRPVLRPLHTVQPVSSPLALSKQNSPVRPLASPLQQSPWSATKKEKEGETCPRLERKRRVSPTKGSFSGGMAGMTRSSSGSPTKMAGAEEDVGREEKENEQVSSATSTLPPSTATKQELVTSAAHAEEAGEEETEDDSCFHCRLPLGYGEFVELPPLLVSSSSPRNNSKMRSRILHRACFTCGGCKEMLGQGKWIEAEGGWWHRECAPPPPRFRSILTSLASSPPPSSPNSPSSSSYPKPLTAPLPPSATPSCAACSTPLGYDGPNVTLPKRGESYHVGCLRCPGCGEAVVSKDGGREKGGRGFVEVGGKAWHEKCAPPPSAPSPSILSSPFFALSSSTTSPSTSPSSSRRPRPISLPLSSSFSSNLHLPPPPPTPPPSSRTLFSTLPRPPSHFGGLLICFGCSTRATEKETVQGPRGRRYHKRCLVCGRCGRGLDSECRVEEGGGGLRCEGCRKTEARKSYRQPAATTTTIASPATTLAANSPRRF
ncbi:hypothetical protein JCM8547_003460 [Rhodosporidiobolus lusitaniae]